MDYILEMLTRQRMALARLLLGGRGTEKEQAQPEAADAVWTEVLPAEQAGQPPEVRPEERSLAGEPMAVRPAAFREVGGAEPADASVSSSDPREREGRAGGQGDGPGSLRGLRRQTGLRPGAEPAVRPEETLWEDGPAGRAIQITEVVVSNGGRAGGAAELSREVERDARRYDGGFRMY